MTAYFPDHQKVAEMPIPSEEEIRNETMLFSAGEDFARKEGGPITQAFLDFLEEERFDWNGSSLDTRVHMLKDGWYPCIPGWHVDGLRRPEGGGQPDWENPPKNDLHYLCVFGEESLTEFLDETLHLRGPMKNEGVYQALNRQIEGSVLKYKTVKYNSGDVVQFGSTGIHRGTPAKCPNHTAWRLFIRASHANLVPKNQIRKQVQVYLTDVEKGW